MKARDIIKPDPEDRWIYEPRIHPGDLIREDHWAFLRAMFIALALTGPIWIALVVAIAGWCR